jgi:hypothetical protein
MFMKSPHFLPRSGNDAQAVSRKLSHSLADTPGPSRCPRTMACTPGNVAQERTIGAAWFVCICTCRLHGYGYISRVLGQASSRQIQCVGSPSKETGVVRGNTKYGAWGSLRHEVTILIKLAAKSLRRKFHVLGKTLSHPCHAYSDEDRASESKNSYCSQDPSPQLHT